MHARRESRARRLLGLLMRIVVLIATFAAYAFPLVAIPLLTICLIGILLLERPARIRQQRLALGLCPSCAYDLTGNTSGICPECGTPIPPPR